MALSGLIVLIVNRGCHLDTHWYASIKPGVTRAKGYVGASTSRLNEGFPLALPNVKVKVKSEAATSRTFLTPPYPPKGGQRQRQDRRCRSDLLEKRMLSLTNQSRRLCYMGYVQDRSKDLKETKRQLAHKAKYSTRQEMSVREQKAKLHDLKAQFLNHNKLGPFVNKIFDIAMDDDHKDQMSAVRLIADRVLPNQSFAHTSKGSNAVQINISGLNVEVKQKEIAEAESPMEDDVVDEQ